MADTPRRRFARIRLALLALLGVCAAAVLTIWMLLYGSLARLDGHLDLPGLSAPATLDRDGQGSVTVTAESEIDAARALGFVHAQERYFEMDLLRRSAAGELSELVGAAALDLDRARRAHRLRARARDFAETLPAERHAVLQAYADGVNAGLRALSVRPWPYLLLRQRPLPWQVEDSALTVFAMFFDLNDSRNRRELERWQMRHGLPEPLFALLDHGGSEWDAPMQGEAYGNAELPDPDALDLRQLPAALAARPEPRYHLRENDALPGSNNWAVSGALTIDRRAIVANDMHLGLRAPNIWFRTRLRYPDPQAAEGRIDAVGVSLPGAPALIVGSNGHVAWGFTNSYGDWLDWFEVHWLDRAEGRYATADGEAHALVHRETIAVAGADPVEIDVVETRWGPVLHDLDDDSSLALAWTAHRSGGMNFDAADLLRARDLDQALTIANRSGIPPQNFVAADGTGRIGWTIMGRLPRRTGDCDPSLPIEQVTAPVLP